MQFEEETQQISYYFYDTLHFINVSFKTIMQLFVLFATGYITIGHMMVKLRNPGRDISFPIFTRKEIETKRIRKAIKTIISRLNHLLSFLSNI